MLGYITKDMALQIAEQYYKIEDGHIQNSTNIRRIPVLAKLDSCAPYLNLKLLRIKAKVNPTLTETQMWENFLSNHLLPHLEGQGIILDDNKAMSIADCNQEHINENMDKGWKEDYPQHSWIT